MSDKEILNDFHEWLQTNVCYHLFDSDKEQHVREFTNSRSNKPQYKIHGDERREFKNVRSHLRRFVKDFWHDHQMDKDMASFYGGSGGFPMSDEDAKTLYNTKVVDLEKLEMRLKEPYE